jgi:hypothetical protein
MLNCKLFPISKYIRIYKYINQTIVISLLLTLLGSFSTSNCYALEQSIRVSPIVSDLQLTPGKPTTINLSIENLSSTSLGIHAEASGMDETSQNIFADQLPSVMTKWTSIASPDIVLDPLSQKTIEVIITPPKDAKQSGYYETIFLTPIISNKKESSSPVVLTRIGAIVLGTIGTLDYNDLVKKISIRNFRPEKYIFDKGPATLTFSVENKYFTHFTAKPFLTIKPLFGQEKTTLPEEKRILPGASKNWKLQATLEKNIFYKASLAISVGNGNQVLAKTWVIVLPYRNIFLLIILLTLLYLVLFQRNRVKKAIFALFKKTDD